MVIIRGIRIAAVVARARLTRVAVATHAIAIVIGIALKLVIMLGGAIVAGP